ncbi:hypothetical protein PCASD_02265 [Puccinia coronata f. sp. avenae]|uniref:Uncharacterized protein n=1 Tax=Puccinia coronata f. sp. avenae TaxID=200324 RepID=A0A2N5VI09_9BASI|nr:hypothetical protein PCASD_02265 [Puccinia coronata f. sp. avenae]
MDTAVDISGGGLDLTRTVNEAQDLAKMNEESRSALQASKLNEANPPTGQQPSATAEISAIRNRHNPTLNRSPFWTTPHGKLFPSVKMRLQRLPHNKKVEWLEDQLYQRAPDKLSVKSHDAAADRFSRKPEEKPPYGSRKLLKPFVQWWQTRHEIPVQELADELEKADPTRLSEHHFSQALGLDDETPASKGLFAKMKFPKIRTQKTPSPTTPIQVGDDKEDVIEGSQSSARVKRLMETAPDKVPDVAWPEARNLGIKVIKPIWSLQLVVQNEMEQFSFWKDVDSLSKKTCTGGYPSGTKSG